MDKSVAYGQHDEESYTENNIKVYQIMFEMAYGTSSESSIKTFQYITYAVGVYNVLYQYNFSTYK